MKIVLLFFCGILITIIILALLIIFSSVKLNIKKCNISNIEGRVKKRLDKQIEIYIEFYLLGIIKLAKLKINKKLFKKLKIKPNIKDVKKDAKIIKSMHLFSAVKRLKIKLEQIELDLKLGVDDVILTSYLVALISSMLRSDYSYFRAKEKRICG